MRSGSSDCHSSDAILVSEPVTDDLIPSSAWLVYDVPEQYFWSSFTCENVHCSASPCARVPTSTPTNDDPPTSHPTISNPTPNPSDNPTPFPSENPVSSSPSMLPSISPSFNSTANCKCLLFTCGVQVNYFFLVKHGEHL